MSEQQQRDAGFAIFQSGAIRRISQTHFLVKTNSDAAAWQLVELKDGKWSCDCGEHETFCSHVYATQLHRYTVRTPSNEESETNPKCRYCGTPDVSRCGFRYNSRGISRRFFCNQCHRKFSISHVRS